MHTVTPGGKENRRVTFVDKRRLEGDIYQDKLDLEKQYANGGEMVNLSLVLSVLLNFKWPAAGPFDFDNRRSLSQILSRQREISRFWRKDRKHS